MKRDDIISLLTRLLGPLKMQPQDNDSQFDKFQDLLKQSLTQPSLEFRRTGVQVPYFPGNMLPDNISEELDAMADEIMKGEANRRHSDPVFWLRQRNAVATAGFEESVENFIEPDFSFGPFINQQSKNLWFHFFQVSKQIRFEIFDSGISDLVVITLPSGKPLPHAGRHTILNFDDCTIWITVKAIAQNSDKKYVGIRAKNCSLVPSGIITLQAGAFATIRAQGFQLSFEPFDKFATGINNNAQPKAAYPDKITFSFTGTKWSLQSFNKSVININGDSIELGEGANIAPVYLEAENLVHFPLPANKDFWEILRNHTERFRLSGKAGFIDAGWYLPV